MADTTKKRKRKLLTGENIWFCFSAVISVIITLIIRQLRFSGETEPRQIAANWGYCIIIFVVITVILGVLIPFIWMTVRSRPFTNEYIAIMEEYDNTKDAAAFYDNLLNMENKPKYKRFESNLRISMVDALYYQKRYEEAWEELNKVEIMSSRVKRYVNELDADLRKKLHMQA